jgi:Uma2 family endonuclease
MSQTVLTPEPYEPFKLNIRSISLTDEQFLRLCQENPELRIELTAQGELVIMPPTGSKTGLRNNELSYALTAWAKADGTGVAFDSSTLFALPNGARRSPDASWVRRERWNMLTEDQQEGPAPLCPDFVVELRSRTDRLTILHEKMQEYLGNGTHLGWLLDPSAKRVYVYHSDQSVEILDNPVTVSGEPVLPGFILNVQELWEL